MPDSQLEIRNLHVRLPGDDRGAGERIAGELRESLQSVPITRSRDLGAMQLRVDVAHDASEADTLRAIRRAFHQALHQE